MARHPPLGEFVFPLRKERRKHEADEEAREEYFIHWSEGDGRDDRRDGDEKGVTEGTLEKERRLRVGGRGRGRGRSEQTSRPSTP